MAEGVTVANAFVQVMPSMEGATSNITSAIMPGMQSAGDQAGAAFGNFFTGKVGGAIKALGGAMVGLFAVDQLTSAYSEVESGLNNLKIATGATGDQAKALEEVYLNVSKSVVGSFGDVGSAVGELNTRFGLQGEELESASEQAMKYAKVTGQDATQAIQDVSRMMNNAGIPASEYASTLDKLTVAGQAAGIDVGKLTTTVTDNAASFKEMGLSTDDAIAMLANFEKSGANTSAILAGMKKGVATWTTEGKSAKEGFAEFVEGVENGTVTAQDAIDIFGAKAGVTMFDAAQKGQLSFDDMYDAIANASDGALDDIYYDTLTAGEKFDLLTKNLQAGFFEVMEPIVDAISPYIDDIVSFVSTAITAIVSFLTPFVETISSVISSIHDQITPLFDDVDSGVSGITEVIQAALPVIMSIVETAIPIIQEVIGGIMGFISDEVIPLLQEVWAIIQPAVETIAQSIMDNMPMIQETMSSVFEFIGSVVETVWPIIRDEIVNAVTIIAAIIQVTWPYIQDIIENVCNKIQFITEDVWPVVKDIIETVSTDIQTAIEDISNVITSVQNTFNTIKDAITNPMETARGIIDDICTTIQNTINSLNLQLPQFAMPHFWVNGGSFPWGIGGEGSPPDFGVDWYGAGGFADSATLTGYGERGLELYWPGYGPYFDKYAQGIAKYMPTGSGVDIHDCNFYVREKDDIRRVAVQLNTLINRQTAGVIA